MTVTQACARSAVLLGEAGIGKSYALAAVLDPKQTFLAWETEARVDLGQVRTWEDLARKARPVLERLTILPLPAANRLQNDEQTPRFLLVLDGVDECQATNKEIAGWFTDLAATYDCRPLHVLIACRSMAYTDALRQAAARAFAITDSDTYTLAPLRRSDLITAASGRNLSPDRFLHAVTTSGAQALARTPLTLKLLLDTFAADDALPASRNALYGFALPRAVMNQGKDRDPAELAGTQEQRFATAARLACYCLLTGAEASPPSARTIQTAICCPWTPSSTQKKAPRPGSSSSNGPSWKASCTARCSPAGATQPQAPPTPPSLPISRPATSPITSSAASN
ncbi:NACHT domain-containing NTPase [Streptomyces sp. NBC_00878]|uniref:NACHT domain-containing protein n=1 Tax=Streptomyces sp. NBC_00878 TaxID=2975854 RepID=UPI00225A4D88|nr:NACHT domain-containing protein [Streptomyces sp. NBC_00878]MCX4911933.1 NACHT domain-containing protein [Streptomyces sp. NBC_00878]